tara:strand:- start:143 stop:460 length:318 start_codon:yes stop_codon:yes gene_type:complete
MRLFLFKILFRFTWWIAPNKPRVNKIFEIYLDYVKAEEDYAECQERQKQLDTSVRPRTETHEWLTCKEQRELYSKGKLIRGSAYTTRRDYTDYDEAQAYHDGKKN